MGGTWGDGALLWPCFMALILACHKHNKCSALSLAPFAVDGAMLWLSVTVMPALNLRWHENPLCQIMLSMHHVVVTIANYSAVISLLTEFHYSL